MEVTQHLQSYISTVIAAFIEFFYSIPFYWQSEYYWPYLLILPALFYLFGKSYGGNLLSWFVANIKEYFLPKPGNRVDYPFLVLYAFIIIFIFSIEILSYYHFVRMGRGWFDSFGLAEYRNQNQSTLLLIGLSLFIALASDFSRFFNHYLMHKIPFLWKFHKVHHAGEDLNIFTLYRLHPVEWFMKRFTRTLIYGSAIAVVSYFFTGMQAAYIGLNVFLLVNHATFLQRHSRLPVTFPRWLSYIFNSPYMHQTHHTPEHCHQNFATCFSFWDGLFGTLYIPDKVEPIVFGLGKGDPSHLSFWGLLTLKK